MTLFLFYQINNFSITMISNKELLLQENRDKNNWNRIWYLYNNNYFCLVV